jgi:hypothetical protein
MYRSLTSLVCCTVCLALAQLDIFVDESVLLQVFVIQPNPYLFLSEGIFLLVELTSAGLIYS